MALQFIPEQTSVDLLRQQSPNIDASKAFSFTINVTCPAYQAFPGEAW